MIPPDSPIKRAIFTAGFAPSDSRPICHYTGQRCTYVGAACTCLLPGFQGVLPTWTNEAAAVPSGVNGIEGEPK